MEPVFYILTAILTPPAVFAALSFVYKRSKKEEAENGCVTRTYCPKRLTVCSAAALIAAAVCVAAGAYFAARGDALSPSGWIAYSLSALLILALPALLFCLSVCTYEILREDGILVRRLTKTKFVPLEDMASYTWSNGQLTVFGRDNAVLFSVGDNRVGTAALLRYLDEKGVLRD
jgi:hypothetical protein